MNIDRILANYDAMFGNYSLPDIEAYLYKNIEEAKDQAEQAVLFTLLNEMIGFCRDTTQKEKALKYCNELLALLESMKLEGSYEYATSLLNIANAYRAFGLLEESIRFFEKVEQLYKKMVQENDFSYANLYNNWALAYQEVKDYKKAKEALLKALHVVDSYEDAKIKQATTRTNLAATLLQMNNEEAYQEAMKYLKRAIEIHEEFNGEDFHYGATLVAMGDAYSFRGDKAHAAQYYKLGLQEIEKHTGKNANYDRVMEKYLSVRVFQSNLERSKEFYYQVGKPMLEEKFPQYMNRIAVGMVGEGSDCFGFDDEISMDHDYEVGFCMWLTDEDYDLFGAELQREYDRLVKNDQRLKYRRGVIRINDFYYGLLELSKKMEQNEEFQLAAATNGEVFVDELGAFSKIREQLKAYYSERIWRRKLAEAMHEYSQYAQSNYARMMARGDVLTAQICLGKAIESAMNLVYLLNRQYAPYYKWKRKGMERFPISKQILPVLEELVKIPVQITAWDGIQYRSSFINKKDKCVVLLEHVATILLDEMKKMDLVSGNDPFLERYIRQILEGKNIELVEQIVDLEWKQFDKVKNEGGRADCQDNYQTFSIMRKSQYLTWPEELLQSFYHDLYAAGQKGWNLIMEKYARMMKSTNPTQYRELEKDLPVLSEKRIAIQEEIIKIQVSWMEAFAEEYPMMAGNARSIRSEEDNAYNTSYETYLRGEMSTYSEQTFILYSRFVVSLLKEERNLAKEIMEHTAKLYGYESLAVAEMKLNQYS